MKAKAIEALKSLYWQLFLLYFRAYSLLVMRSTTLTSLGLRSLQNINDGGVYITGNKKLCYHDTVNWTRILSSGSRPQRRQKHLDIKDNAPSNQCGEWGWIISIQLPYHHWCQWEYNVFCSTVSAVKEGYVCDPLCSSDGCWGPGPDQCVSCKNYRRGGTCVPDCMFLTGSVFAK